jgi:hypothetical protein
MMKAVALMATDVSSDCRIWLHCVGIWKTSTQQSK